MTIIKPLTTLFLTACAICHASTFTVNESITLNSNAIISSSGNEFYNQQFGIASPITLQAGDQITGTVTFTDGPVLIEAPAEDFNESVGVFFSPESGAPSTSSTDNMDLIGLMGVFPETNPTPTVGSSGGPFVAFEFTNGDAFDYSFTGFTYTININSLSAGPTPYYFSQLSLEGQTIEFGVSAGTPEPSSIALCGLGCAALAWACRRRPSIRC